LIEVLMRYERDTAFRRMKVAAKWPAACSANHQTALSDLQIYGGDSHVADKTRSTAVSNRCHRRAAKFPSIATVGGKGPQMLSFIIGQTLGMSVVESAGLGIVEGIVLVVVITRLAERFIFRMPED
jgi:hypothetical protein